MRVAGAERDTERDVEDAVPYDAWGTWEEPSNQSSDMVAMGYGGRGWNPAPTEVCSNPRFSDAAVTHHAAAAKRFRGRRCGSVRKFRDTDLNSSGFPIHRAGGTRD